MQTTCVICKGKTKIFTIEKDICNECIHMGYPQMLHPEEIKLQRLLVNKRNGR